MNPFYIILIVGGLLIVPTLIGAYKLDLKIVGLLPTSISENEIKLNVNLQIKNMIGKRLDISSLTSEVYFQGINIGSIAYNSPIVLLASKSQIIGLPISISSSILGDTIWKEAINRNLQNFVLEFRGKIKIDNLSLPFNSTWTIQDFVSGTGIGSIGNAVQDKFERYFDPKEFELVEPFGSLWKSRGQVLYVRPIKKDLATYNGAIEMLRRQNWVEEVMEAGGDHIIYVKIKKNYANT